MSKPGHGRRTVAATFLGLVLVILSACTAGKPSASNWHEPPGDDSGPGASSGVPVPSPHGSTGASTTAAGDFGGRLPKFGAPPAATPIQVPPGAAAPIYKHLPINQPVAFLTIDDGWVQQPVDIQLMKAAHIPFTMFLIAPVAAGNPSFFQQLETAGGVVEDHTITHPDMRGKAYPFQQHEVCAARTSLEHTFSTTMHLFRPPFGDYDQTTLRVVHDCGLTAAFFWSETVNNGTVFYQTAEHKIHPGDIILMHFRPAFVNDVIAALTAIHNAGLTPALLENYFPAAR